MNISYDNRANIDCYSYITSLLKMQRKFEGWVQVELAKMLAQSITGGENAVLCEENIPGAN